MTQPARYPYRPVVHILLLVLAVLCFAIFALIGFGWISVHGNDSSGFGWLGLGSVFFAGSFL